MNKYIWYQGKPLKIEKKYIVTVKTKFGNNVALAKRYLDNTNNWRWQLLGHELDPETEEIIAWMECPEAFGG